MAFLSTRAGLIAGKYIVRISALCKRPTGNYHEIEYCAGSDIRSTTASESAVHEFQNPTF